MRQFINLVRKMSLLFKNPKSGETRSICLVRTPWETSKHGSTENAGPKNERPMRDHLDQRATDTTGK